MKYKCLSANGCSCLICLMMFKFFAILLYIQVCAFSFYQVRIRFLDGRKFTKVVLFRLRSNILLNHFDIFNISSDGLVFISEELHMLRFSCLIKWDLLLCIVCD